MPQECSQRSHLASPRCFQSVFRLVSVVGVQIIFSVGDLIRNANPQGGRAVWLYGSSYILVTHCVYKFLE